MTSSSQRAPDPRTAKAPAPGFFARRRQARPRAHAPLKPSIIAEFQSDAVEIEERTPPRIARITLYSVVALILAMVAWASLSSVDTIVIARGKLIATSPNVAVQPLETSIIREIKVKVGDVVGKGQPLAILDPTFSQADTDQLRTRVVALDAAIKRLQSELSGSDYVAADSSNPDELLQEKLFRQRRAFYETSLRNYDAQIASAQANLKAGEDEEALLRQRLETLQAIETMRSSLMDKQVGSRLNFLLSKDARLEVENNLARVVGSEADYRHRVEKARADRQVFADDFRRTAYQELVDTRAKQNSAAEELKKAERRRQLTVMSAPVDAVVLEIANRTVGSVVREAETLFVLVPRDAPLQAEVNVEGRDIGQVSIGQPVRIKFDAFPFQKYGTGSGTVSVVSKDSFASETKGDGSRRAIPAYYRVLLDITNARLRAQPAQFQMIPGMELTAEMKVGKRRVISYFLYPLLRGLDESIREP